MLHFLTSESSEFSLHLFWVQRVFRGCSEGVQRVFRGMELIEPPLNSLSTPIEMPSYSERLQLKPGMNSGGMNCNI